MPGAPQTRSHSWLLLAGAALGIGMAAVGLGGAAAPRGLPSGAVARVNGEIIRREDFERALAALAADRRSPIGEPERRQVLERLIDEELLVQRGLALGLARSDRKIRGDLTAAVIGSIVSEYEDLQPSAEELQRFYDEHRDFFVRPGRVRVRQVFCRVTGSDDSAALSRARTAAQRLRAGEEIAAVRAGLGDPELAALPDALLPAAKLREYLGPSVLQAALALGAGEVSEPVRSAIGYHVLQVVEREPDSVPPAAELQLQLAAEYRRRAGEQALRRYLDDLRGAADVDIAADPAGTPQG